jgi:hypothetical protein
LSAIPTKPEKNKLKRLTLEQFIVLAKKLPADKISQIPLSMLPPNIPPDVTEKVPASSRSAVEDLLLSLNSFHLKNRMADVNNYGEAVVAAMDRVKVSCNSNTLRVFKNKILQLIKLLQDSKQENKKISEETLVNQIISINNLLLDVRSEHQTMITIADTLKQAKPVSEQDHVRFNSLKNHLNKSIKATENTLAEYYILRLKLLANIINEKRKNIEQSEKLTKDYREELYALQTELESTKTLWNRTIKRKATLEIEQQVQQRIQELIGEINQKEIIISENDLMLWLDTIVEASLNSTSQVRVTKSLRTARVSLYFLLNKFCKLQEDAAIQIAQNPFIQVDPKEAIKYVLMSEKFILDYFTKKKNETTAWLSGAAENKISELESLQKEILAELKRASRSFL